MTMNGGAFGNQKLFWEKIKNVRNQARNSCVSKREIVNGSM